MTANTRTSKIEFKRSNVPGARPPSLLPGEPAINITDGKLFFQLVNGKIVNVSSTPVGNTYYVSAEGNDIDDGLTPGRALKTIRKASMLAKPGDSIVVSSGHYIEQCPIIIAQNVQVQGAGERNCLIQPTDPTKDVFWVNNNSYVTGFKFVDRTSAAIAFPDEIERGTAQSVTSNTITLSTSSEEIDGYYDSMQITIISGNGKSLIYNQDYCARDVGYIVDSISFDMLYGGNRQAFQSALYYYGYNLDSQTIVPNEIKEVNAAYHYLSNVASQIILGQTIVPYQNNVSQNTSVATGSISEVKYTQNSVNQIINIINHGPGAANTKTPISLTRSNSANVLNAVNALHANREFIQSEVSAYVTTNFVSNTVTGYDESKCLRDTNLIIDSVAFDILYNSNTQSQFSGLQYWANSQTPSKIPGEVTQTILAIGELKTVVLDWIATLGVHNTLPVTYDMASDLFDYLINILSNGTSTITDTIVSNSYESLGDSIPATVQLLQTNKTSIQDDVSSWITNQINTALPTSPWYQFTFDETYCYRDIGYIIDCICFDLRHGGNRQTTQAGVYYYTYNSEISQIATERPESIAAFNYLKSMIGKVVIGQTITPTYQNTYSQLITGNTASSTQANSAYSKVGIITNIISNGPVEVSRVPISLTQSADVNDLYAFNQILQNKDFLSAEVIGYINNVINAPFIFDEAKANNCYRDIGLIVDSVAQDLLFQTDSQSNFTGIQYWSKNGYTGQIESELEMTIGALEYAKNLCSQIVLNDANGTRYQDLQQQHVGNLIYSKDYCGRDVGYIIDSVSFDLLFGGNRQAFQSAVYYYGFSNNSSTVIPGELTQVTDAYNHLKDIAGQIILGETVTPYQNTVSQNTSISFGTSSEVSTVSNTVNYIINIITNGPSVANTKIPMPLTKVYNQNQINAANILEANKDFIVAEVIAYIGNTYPAFSYNQSKCERDTGLIVDAIAQDLLFQTKSQSTFTGLQYWSKDNYTGKIGSELTITVDAINYAKNLCSKVVVNDATGTRYQTTLKQVFDDAASNTEVSIINGEFDYITTLMTSDTTGITDTIIPNTLEASSNTNVINAYNLLQRNKKYIQSEVIAWVESNKSNYLFNPGTQSEVDIISNEFDYITNILSNGTVGVTDTIIPNGYTPSSNTNVINAYNLLQDNKEYIKAEVVAWVESNKFVNQANVVSYIGNTKTAILDTNWAVLPDNNCQYFARIPIRNTAAPLSQRYSTFIVGSPYIYNCSSISYYATGIRVDGNLAMGNKSIVSAQFTQFNSGGTGMYIKNDGYAQLVGIYGMFCDRAFVAENGGTASMGNCNVNFGNYGLVAIGKGGLAMTAKLKGDSEIGSKTLKIYNIRTNPKLSVRAPKPYAGMIMKVHNDPNPNAYYIVESAETVGEITTVTFALRSTKSFPDNTNVYFYQQSQLRASGQTFEYVGAGIDMQKVLPKYGGVVDPAKQTLMIGEGVVYATATDQNGNFIVSELSISQATSSIVGRTFEKSLFAQMTPYILAIQ